MNFTVVKSSESSPEINDLGAFQNLVKKYGIKKGLKISMNRKKGYIAEMNDIYFTIVLSEAKGERIIITSLDDVINYRLNLINDFKKEENTVSKPIRFYEAAVFEKIVLDPALVTKEEVRIADNVRHSHFSLALEQFYSKDEIRIVDEFLRKLEASNKNKESFGSVDRYRMLVSNILT